MAIVTTPPLDRGGVFADNARQDGLFQCRRNGVQSRPKGEQITHADDAALGLHVENKEIAGVAKGVAFQPGRLRPRYPQDTRVDGGDGHVRHDASSTVRVSSQSAADGAG